MTTSATIPLGTVGVFDSSCRPSGSSRKLEYFLMFFKVDLYCRGVTCLHMCSHCVRSYNLFFQTLCHMKQPLSSGITEHQSNNNNKKHKHVRWGNEPGNTLHPTRKDPSVNFTRNHHLCWIFKVHSQTSTPNAILHHLEQTNMIKFDSQKISQRKSQKRPKNHRAK